MMEPVKVAEIQTMCSEGNQYIINIWQHYKSVGDDKEWIAIFPSRKEFRTNEGYVVNRIDEKRFFIQGPDVEVSRM